MTILPLPYPEVFGMAIAKGDRALAGPGRLSRSWAESGLPQGNECPFPGQGSHHAPSIPPQLQHHFPA
jgi:hypothetical protein